MKQFLAFGGIDGLLNIPDFASEIGAGINVTGYLFTGIGDSGRITTAQFLADLGQRAVGFLPDEIHGQPAGQNCLLISLFASEVGRGQLKASGYGF